MDLEAPRTAEGGGSGGAGFGLENLVSLFCFFRGFVMITENLCMTSFFSSVFLPRMLDPIGFCMLFLFVCLMMII